MPPHLKPTETRLKTLDASRTARCADFAPRAHRAVFARLVTCRDFAPECWFQTFPPYGRYPALGAGGLDKKAKNAEFVFDEATAKTIIDNFHANREAHPDWPGILVDREHFSEDPEKPSDAMAWATDIRLDPDGSIWTKWDFTPSGRELWESKTLVAALAQEEIDAYRRSAVNDPVCPQIRSTVAYVRGVIRSAPTRVKLNPDEETLPESLIMPAMDYLRFSVCIRQNIAANESRTKAYENAVQLFRELRDGRFVPESDDVTDDSRDIAGSPAHGTATPTRLLD